MNLTRNAWALTLAAMVAPAPLAWAQDDAGAQAGQAGQAEAGQTQTGQAQPQTQLPGAEDDPAGAAAAAALGLTQTEAPTAEEISYALGWVLGRDLQRTGMQIEDTDRFVAGLRAAQSGAEPEMSQTKIQSVVMHLQQQAMNAQREAQQEMMQEWERLGEEQAAQGPEFLAQNRQKEGVQVTDSGLQYQVLEEGQGETPDLEDVVRVQYRGQLVDGTVFDSSYERGQPASFPVSGVIEGWSEGLQLMKEGGKYRLVVPAELGYGTQGAPPVIPPNSTLIFEVELLEVLDQQGAAGAPGAGAGAGAGTGAAQP